MRSKSLPDSPLDSHAVRDTLRVVRDALAMLIAESSVMRGTYESTRALVKLWFDCDPAELLSEESGRLAALENKNPAVRAGLSGCQLPYRTKHLKAQFIVSCGLKGNYPKVDINSQIRSRFDPLRLGLFARTTSGPVQDTNTIRQFARLYWKLIIGPHLARPQRSRWHLHSAAINLWAIDPPTRPADQYSGRYWRQVSHYR